MISVTHDEGDPEAHAKLLGVGLVDPALGMIFVDVEIVEENEKGVEEMRKAREASYVLVEVANVEVSHLWSIPVG